MRENLFGKVRNMTKTKKLDPQLLDISKKIDMIIRLLALNLVKDSKTQKDKIALLANAGFKPKEIAEILNTTRNTVNVALASLRKKKQTKARNKGPKEEESIATTNTAGSRTN